MDKKTLIDGIRFAVSTTLLTAAAGMAAYTGVYVANKFLGPLDINLKK